MKKPVLVTFSLLALLAFGSGARGDDAEQQWPSDQEQRLSAIGDEIIDLLGEERQAQFANDEAKVDKIEKRLNELNKEKMKLLRQLHMVD